MNGVAFEWGVASRARPGEAQSGDRHCVRVLPDGALMVVVDGLGHGSEAAFAADLAILTVDMYKTRPLPDIVKVCHERLRRTRGTALSLARWHAGRCALEWLGVGNVEALVGSAAPGGVQVRDRLLLRGGVVGGNLPELRTATVAVRGDSRLIFATDGIANGFDQGLDLRSEPQALADRILAHPSRIEDDALVLVARLGGRC